MISKTKAVIVTGAAGGIGRALCAGFARDGYHVIATDIHPSESIGDRYIACDLTHLVSNQETRNSFAAQVKAAVAGLEITCLVNNAAVQILGAFESLDENDWSQSLTTNLMAPILLSKAFAQDLERGSGSIINIASIHSLLTKPLFTAYATSKAALTGFTRSLAIEWGGKIRVNAICPAAVDTEMLRAGFENDQASLSRLGELHPAKRIGKPEEIAAAAVFLASPNASFITGCILQVDGGISSRLYDIS